MFQERESEIKGLLMHCPTLADNEYSHWEWTGLHAQSEFNQLIVIFITHRATTLYFSTIWTLKLSCPGTSIRVQLPACEIKNILPSNQKCVTSVPHNLSCNINHLLGRFCSCMWHCSRWWTSEFWHISRVITGKTHSQSNDRVVEEQASVCCVTLNEIEFLTWVNRRVLPESQSPSSSTAVLALPDPQKFPKNTVSEKQHVKHKSGLNCFSVSYQQVTIKQCSVTERSQLFAMLNHLLFYCQVIQVRDYICIVALRKSVIVQACRDSSIFKIIHFFACVD